jgi:hypothetical protein
MEKMNATHQDINTMTVEYNQHDLTGQESCRARGMTDCKSREGFGNEIKDLIINTHIDDLSNTMVLGSSGKTTLFSDLIA